MSWHGYCEAQWCDGQEHVRFGERCPEPTYPGYTGTEATEYSDFLVSQQAEEAK